MSGQPPPAAIFVRLFRAGRPESLHRGHLLAIRRGQVVASAGDPHHLVFVRSAAKPVQALTGITSGAVEGFGMDDRCVAISCASHMARPEHLAAAQAILDAAHVPHQALGCGGHYSFDPDIARLQHPPPEGPPATPTPAPACANPPTEAAASATQEVASDPKALHAAWMADQGVELIPSFDREAARLDAAGAGYLRVAVAGSEQALIGLDDRVRQDAPVLIDALKRDGMDVTLLSGDRQATAEIIARRLGGMRVIAEVLPEQKDRVIAGLQADGRRVAMVGDGVNDAPALVRADVGIALGSGTDVSIASADIVLISNELEKVRLAAALSRRTLRTIRQNIGISIAYNLIMVPLAMLALITPLIAAISMPVSSLLVIGNAARIRTLFKSGR